MKRPLVLLLSLASVSLLLLLSGCNYLEPSVDLTRYYILESNKAKEVQPETSDRLALVIGVRRIQVPDYLLSTRIAIRRQGNEIVYSDYNRWSERLDTGIGRMLANALQESGAASVVQIPPWPRAQARDYLIDIQVVKFEGDNTGQVTLTVDWELCDGAGTIIQRDRFEYADAGWAGADYSDLVQHMSNCVDALARFLHDRLAVASTPASLQAQTQM